MDPKVSSAGLCRFTLSLDHPASSSPELVLQEGLPRAARTALVSSGLHICQAVTLSTQVYLHLLSSYHPQSCCIALCVSHKGLSPVLLWYLWCREETTTFSLGPFLPVAPLFQFLLPTVHLWQVLSGNATHLHSIFQTRYPICPLCFLLPLIRHSSTENIT